MRYSGRTATARPAKYSLSAANAQAKARKRGEVYHDTAGSHSRSALEDLAGLGHVDGSRGKRYKHMADRHQPKVYKGRAQDARGYQRKQPEVTYDQERLPVEVGVQPMKPTPNRYAHDPSLAATQPMTGIKRPRSPEFETPPPMHVPQLQQRKRPRYESPDLYNPDPYSTPMQPRPTIRPPSREHRCRAHTDRVDTGAHCRSPSSAYQNPPQPQMRGLNFTNLSGSPIPFRYSSPLIMSKPLKPTHTVQRQAWIRKPPISPYPSALSRPSASPAFFKHPGPSYALEHDLPSLISYPHPTFQGPLTRRSTAARLPYGRPHVRTQTFPDYARKAPAMSFQPTMPIIQEESPIPANGIFSPPLPVVEPFLHFGHDGHHPDDKAMSPEAQIYTPYTEPPVYNPPAPTLMWQAHRATDIVSSQSTASHDENLRPSQESVGSLPIFAPKASMGIDIDALEAAARSPSTELDAGGLSLECPAESLPTVKAIPFEVRREPDGADKEQPKERPTLTFTRSDKPGFPVAPTQSSVNIGHRRPKPKQRCKARLEATDTGPQDEPKPLSAIRPAFHSGLSTFLNTNEANEGTREETDTIVSFEDDIPWNIDKMHSREGSFRVKETIESSGSPDQQRTEVEERIDRSSVSEQTAGCREEIEDQSFPGFVIWSDHSG